MFSFDNTKTDIDYQYCWAKTDKAKAPALMIWQHGLNVGAVASAIIDSLPDNLKDLVPSGFTILSAVHDVGKISIHFQTLCSSWSTRFGYTPPTGENVHHSVISQYTLESMGVSEQLCQVVGYHHGSNEYHEKFDKRWQNERIKYAQKLELAIGESLPKGRTKFSLSHKFFLCGLLVLADWIGSSEEFFPLDWEGSFYESKKRAEAALSSLKLVHKTLQKPFDFYETFNFQPHGLQHEFLKFFKNNATSEGGVFVLRAPMGVGKTEAALAAAAIDRKIGSRGIFFGLPTTLTSDRIFLRMEEFLSKIDDDYLSLRRLHGKAHFYTEQIERNDSAFSAVDWFGRSMKKGMIAPYGVGTVDQALLGVLPVKHFFLRLFTLAGKTIILDEVHSYDAYTGSLLKLLIEYLVELRCNVIVISATLTSKWLEKMFNAKQIDDFYPSAHFFNKIKQLDIPLTGKQGNSVAIELVALDGGSTRDFIENTLELAHSKNANILWVCNTVDEAQRLFFLLKGANIEGGPEIALLHSRYLLNHRRSIEELWMNRLGKSGERISGGSILIGTQVVEQSLDIDVDYMITELAPMDFLLQRAGRLWRHTKSRPISKPQMTITVSDFPSNILTLTSSNEIKKKLGRSANVYCPYILLRTLSILSNKVILKLPDDIQTLLEATYVEKQEDQEVWLDFFNKRKEYESKLTRLANIASKNEHLPVRNNEDELIASTRYQEYDTFPLLIIDKKTPDGFILDQIEFCTKGRIDTSTQAIIQSREILVPAYRFENSPKSELNYKKYILVETNGKIGWTRMFPEDNLKLTYSLEAGLKIEITEGNDEFS